MLMIPRRARESPARVRRRPLVSAPPSHLDLDLDLRFYCGFCCCCCCSCLCLCLCLQDFFTCLRHLPPPSAPRPRCRSEPLTLWPSPSLRATMPLHPHPPHSAVAAAAAAAAASPPPAQPFFRSAIPPAAPSPPSPLPHPAPDQPPRHHGDPSFADDGINPFVLSRHPESPSAFGRNPVPESSPLGSQGPGCRRSASQQEVRPGLASQATTTALTSLPTPALALPTTPNCPSASELDPFSGALPDLDHGHHPLAPASTQTLVQMLAMVGSTLLTADRTGMLPLEPDASSDAEECPAHSVSRSNHAGLFELAPSLEEAPSAHVRASVEVEHETIAPNERLLDVEPVDEGSEKDVLDALAYLPGAATIWPCTASSHASSSITEANEAEVPRISGTL